MASTAFSARKKSWVIPGDAAPTPHLQVLPSPSPRSLGECHAEQRVLHLEDERGSGRLIPFPLRSDAAPRLGLDDERGSGRVVEMPPASNSATHLRQRLHEDAATQTTPQANLPFRLVAVGSREAVMENIKMLHHLGYAEAVAWSSLQRGFGDDEYISILTLKGSRPQTHAPG